MYKKLFSRTDKLSFATSFSVSSAERQTERAAEAAEGGRQRIQSSQSLPVLPIKLLGVRGHCGCFRWAILGAAMDV